MYFPISPMQWERIARGANLHTILTISPETDSERLASLSILAVANNCVLKKSKRGDLNGKPYELSSRSVAGLSYKVLRVSEDITDDESVEMASELSGKKSRSIGHALVEAGLKSLGQVITADVNSRNESRLLGLRSGFKVAAELLKSADAFFDDKAAELESRALGYIQNAIHRNVKHLRTLEAGLNDNSPRTTFHLLEAVCDEKTFFAHSIISSLKSPTSKLRTYPASVLYNSRGVGGLHTCVFAKLSDGGYQILDPSMPEASGKIPKDVLPPNSVKTPTEQEPIVSFDLVQNMHETGKIWVSRFHRRLQIMDPLDYMLGEHLMKLSLQYKKVGDDKLAQKQVFKVLELNPQSAEAYCILGRIEKDRDNLDSAEEFTKKAIDLNPRFTYAISTLGDIYCLKGDGDAALKKYREALDIDPNDADAISGILSMPSD